MKVFGVSLEMSSDPKKYFGFTFDQFTELVYTAKIAQLSTQSFVRLPVTVSNRLNARQTEIFTEFPLKDSFKLLDGISNVKRS